MSLISALAISALAYIATPTVVMTTSVGALAVVAAVASEKAEANSWPTETTARAQTIVTGGDNTAAIAASNGYYNTYSLTGTCIAGTVWTFYTVTWVYVMPPIKSPLRGIIKYWRQDC